MNIDAATALRGQRTVTPKVVDAMALGETGLLCDPAGCLYWPDEKCLIVSDMHLEKGASYARRGQLLPPYDTGATLATLSARIEFWQPSRIISLGDSFHDTRSSEAITDRDRKCLAALMRGREWIWVSGNHDPELPADLPGERATELAIGGISLRHEPTPNPAGFEIAGHLHPQARIVRRGKAVRRRCFASDGRRLIMPAFGAYTGGLNIRDRAFAGLLSESGLHAYVIGRDRIYRIAGKRLV